MFKISRHELLLRTVLGKEEQWSPDVRGGREREAIERRRGVAFDLNRQVIIGPPSSSFTDEGARKSSESTSNISASGS